MCVCVCVCVCVHRRLISSDSEPSLTKRLPSAVTTERGLENPPGAGPANWTELPKTVGGLCQRGAGGHAGLC